MLLRHLPAQDARPRRRRPALPEAAEARPATCPGYDPLGPQEDRPQGHTILHAGNGSGRVQSPAYIMWKRQNYDEILKRHDGNETFSRFWSRVHELYERQTGLSVYVRI